MSDAKNIKRAGLTAPLKVFVAGCAVALVIVGFLIVAGRVGTAKWERYAEKLRAAGQPLTFAEIEGRRAVIPEDQNSARVIEQLLPQLAAIDPDTADRLVLVVGRSTDKLDFFNGIPRYTLQPSRAFLDRHRAVLDQLAVLRDMPVGHFKIDYQQPLINIVLPNYAPLRKGAKLAHLDAILHLLDGELGPAASDAELLFALAGTLHDEPVLISRLVQLANESLGVKVIENILRVGQLDVNALQRLCVAVNRRLTSSTMKWGLWGERAFWIETCEQVADGRLSVASLTTDETGASGLRMLPQFLLRANQLTGAEMHTSLVDAVDDPRALLAAAQKIEAAVPNLPRTQFVVKIAMPSLSRAMTLQITSYAELVCTRSALAAEAFRLRTGRLPNSLSELAPDDLSAAPTDPFDGQPLRLATTDRGIVIYSIGEDFTDNGGDVARNADRKRPPDVGFRLLALEHRGIPLTDEPPPPEE